MLESTFCNGVVGNIICVWSWRLIITFVILFVGYKLIRPKKVVH